MCRRWISAFHRLRTDEAVAVPRREQGVSSLQALEAKIEDLHGRLRTKRYLHQPQSARASLPRDERANDCR